MNEYVALYFGLSMFIGFCYTVFAGLEEFSHFKKLNIVGKILILLSGSFGFIMFFGCVFLVSIVCEIFKFLFYKKCK